MSIQPPSHPPWCSRPRCTLDRPGLGVHRSRPRIITTEGGARLAISLWTPGRYPDGTPGPTYVELVTRTHGTVGRRTDDLTVPEARQLAYGLATLVDLASRPA